MSLQSVKDPNDNKSELAQVVAWRQSGDKPLPGQILTTFNHVRWRR